MGRRGPPPTPTPLLTLRGSTLSTRGRREREVQGPDGVPRCPDWLDDDDRAAWKHLVPLLNAMGVLTRIDGNALARYCRLWSRWRKAEDFILEKGEMYPLRDENGAVKYFQPWPQVAIAHRLASQLTRLEQEFGMTPSSRSRIQLPERRKTADHDKARFFQAG